MNPFFDEFQQISKDTSICEDVLKNCPRSLIRKKVMNNPTLVFEQHDECLQAKTKEHFTPYFLTASKEKKSSYCYGHTDIMLNNLSTDLCNDERKSLNNDLKQIRVLLTSNHFQEKCLSLEDSYDCFIKATNFNPTTTLDQKIRDPILRKYLNEIKNDPWDGPILEERSKGP